MKKHTFSRVLSMVLCLVLALSAICLPAYAEKGGEATERRGASTDTMCSRARRRRRDSRRMLNSISNSSNTAARPTAASESVSTA